MPGGWWAVAPVGGDKIPATDSAHIEVWHTGCTDPAVGGVALSTIELAMRQEPALRDFGPVRLRPLKLHLNPNNEIELRWEVQTNSSLWGLFQALRGHFDNPCSQAGSPFHTTIARSATFRNTSAMAEYFSHAESVVAGWRAQHPTGVVVGSADRLGGVYLFRTRQETVAYFPPAGAAVVAEPSPVPRSHPRASPGLPGPPPPPETYLQQWCKVGTMAVYFAIWIMLLFPSILPLGRPATAVVGAMACLCLRLLAGFEMAAGPHISWDPIFLLFGLMLVNLYVEQTGVYRKLIDAIDSPRQVIIMLKICLVSSVLSAFLMNDTICLVMAPAVTKLCQQKRIRSTPFLLALSTSANIGSALTIVGNPQNALVAGICKLITFNGFIKHNAIPVLVCAVMNCACLFLFARYTTTANFSDPDEENTVSGDDAENTDYHHQAAPASPPSARTKVQQNPLSPRVSSSMQTPAIEPRSAGVELVELKHKQLKDPADVASSQPPLQPTEAFGNGSSNKDNSKAALALKRNNSKAALALMVADSGGSNAGYFASVGVIVALMVGGFFFGLDVSGVAVAAGCLLMTGHALRRRRVHHQLQQQSPASKAKQKPLPHESDTILLDIDFGLLLLFVGQFVMAGAMVDTGYPQHAFASLLGEKCSGSNIVGSWGCLVWFSTIVALMSNLISNVPVILMLRPVLEVLPASTQLQVWVITAWVATLAGNFIILGSAANLIVAHQAAKLGDGSFTAIEHGKFGLPSTTLLLFGGMAIIHQTF